MRRKITPMSSRVSEKFMRGILAIVAVMVSIATPVNAQEPARIADREFILLSGGLVMSSLFDAYTTNRALESCMTCREANPIARPFVEAGPVGTYGFALGTSALMIGGAYYLKRRGYRWRWVLIAGTVTHVAVGGLNLRYVH